MEDPETKDLWTLREIAAAVGVSPRQLRNYEYRGLLAGGTRGGVWLTTDEEARRFIAWWPTRPRGVQTREFDPDMKPLPVQSDRMAEVRAILEPVFGELLARLDAMDARLEALTAGRVGTDA